MIPAPPLSLLVLVLLQGSPLPPSAGVDCQEVQRIELSLEPGASREVCVSPGLLTGFVFDSPVVVDVQDEPRFVEVTHGRTTISVMPPGDMGPGERFRLTARFTDGASSDSITFMLVAHVGQATRQVEVSRDKRTRESFQHEVAQERAKHQQLSEENQRLRGELERMRARLHQSAGLRSVIINGAMGPDGVAARVLGILEARPEQESSAKRGACYRSAKNVAVAVWLRNSGTEPWTVAGASFARDGEPMKGVVWHGETIGAGETGLVVVEVNGAEDALLRGEATLSLWEAGPRVIHIPQVTFP